MKFFKVIEKQNYTKIVFDHSGAANSFGLGQAEELLDIISTLKKKLPKFIVWSSAAREHGRNIFCAGGNLKAYKKLATKNEGIQINRTILKALNELYELSCFKLALLEGDVYGGGLEILSCFDSVISLPDVKLAFWQSKQNLSTGWGGFTRWAQKVDTALLKKLIKSAETFSPYEAIEYGFVDKVVESVDDIDFSTLNINNYQENRKLDYTKEIDLFESLWWSEAHLKILKSLKI